MYIINQFKRSFLQLLFLSLNEVMGAGGNDQEQAKTEQKKENPQDVYKNQEWYKKLSVEQQQVIDKKIENRVNLEKKIDGLKSEVKFQGLKAEIIEKGIDRNKPKMEDAEDQKEIKTFEDRVDMLNREIDSLGKDIYALELEKNGDNLRNSFDKANKNFKEKFADSVPNASDAAKDIIEKKDLSTITAGEIYSLRQEGYDLSTLFLSADGKDVSKDSMKIGDNFTVDFGGNQSLNSYIGAGDLLPIEKFDKIKVNGVEGTRRFDPRPGYYSAEGKYLAIFDNYNVEVVSEKEVTPDELEKSKQAFKARFDEIRGTELASNFRDVLESAGENSSVKLEGMTEGDFEYMKGYISRYLPKDKFENLQFDTGNLTISTKDGKGLGAYIKESMPMGAGYEKYKDIVAGVCEQFPNIPADKLATLINHENGRWDPMASAPGSTAYGLGQMIDSTWNTYGKGLDRNNPTDQLIATCKYLTNIMQRNNCPVEIAMAYYNTGEGILSLSNSKVQDYYRKNPAIARKIPSGTPITPKTYLTGAVAYYNDISFDAASKKV